MKTAMLHFTARLVFLGMVLGMVGFLLGGVQQISTHVSQSKCVFVLHDRTVCDPFMTAGK